MLREALRKNPNRQQTASVTRAEAPTGGWDAISPLAKMKPDRAVILDNWIPKPGYVEIRKGSRIWQNGAPNPVQTLITWKGASSGVDKLFAASGTGIYPITTLLAAWPASSYAITSPRVEYTSFANDGGSFTICANGADAPFRYDGTTFAALTITGSSGPITLNPTKLNYPTNHKSRLHFLESGTLRTWFLDTQAIQGTAQLLDLGPFCREGGYLIGLGTWSNPYGVGQDDYFVAITSEGEVIIFQGDDPSNSLYWTQVGVFHLGKPRGGRALLKFGGDLLAITSNGVISFNQAIKLDRSQQNAVALTQNIQNAFSLASQSYGTNFGWDAILYDTGSLAIFNVPVAELATSHQYVQNLQTGAWCRFIGLNAFCWATANGNIYFGVSDGVYQWDIGVTDAGTDLDCELLCAYNYFGNSNQKNFTMVRPILNATANVLPAIEIDTDFQQTSPVAMPTVVDTRSTDLSIRADWNGCQGVGFAGAVHMLVTLSAADLQSQIATGDGNVVGDGAGNELVTDSGEPPSADIQFINADILYEAGGPL